MGMYVSNAGKSGGEYFTPQEVSELLARLTIVGKDSVIKYMTLHAVLVHFLKYAKILETAVRNGYYDRKRILTTYNFMPH